MIRKVATSIDQLSKTQLQTAKELATFFCAVKGKVYEGQDIDVTILFDICTSVFEIEPGKMKGAIKPYHKHYERHAQLAFLWACKFYSNEMFAGADYLGCYQRSIKSACDTFSSHLQYSKENGRFKYEKRYKLFSDKLLLIVAACNDLCPYRKSLFIAKGVLPPVPQPKHTPMPDSTYQSQMQEITERLKRAQAKLEEASKIDAETTKHLKELAERFAQMNYDNPTGIAQRISDLGKMRYDVKANAGSKLFVLEDRKERLFTTFIN